MTKLEAHVQQHDREIAAIRKLLLTGMKMLVELQAAQKETDRMLKQTDRMLQDLIRSLGRGGAGNGHRRSG